MIKLAQLIESSDMGKIETVHDPKSIPVRNYDWEATHVDYEEGDPIGYGETKEQAIEDLIDQLRDREYPGFEHDDEDTAPRDVPGFEGTRDALDDLGIRESKDFNKTKNTNRKQVMKDQNFDLKKFLVENKLTSNSKRLTLLEESTEDIQVTKDDFIPNKYIEFIQDGKEYQVEFDDYEEFDNHGYQSAVMFMGQDQFGDEWEIEATVDNMSGDVDEYDIHSIQRAQQYGTNEASEKKVQVTKDRFPHVEFMSDGKKHTVKFELMDYADGDKYFKHAIFVGDDQYGDQWSINVTLTDGNEPEEWDLDSIEKV